MVIEILIMLYFLIGILVYWCFKHHVIEHILKVKANKYIARIIYIVTFLTTLLFWPLVL